MTKKAGKKPTSAICFPFNIGIQIALPQFHEDQRNIINFNPAAFAATSICAENKI